MINIIQVRHEKALPDRSTKPMCYLYGEAQVVPKEQIGFIRIARNRNKTLDVWLKTFVHECIHIASDLFFPLLFKVRVDARSEHKFIDAIEKAIDDNLHLLKERRRGKKKEET